MAAPPVDNDPRPPGALPFRMIPATRPPAFWPIGVARTSRKVDAVWGRGVQPCRWRHLVSEGVSNALSVSRGPRGEARRNLHARGRSHWILACSSVAVGGDPMQGSSPGDDVR